jgi:hypothetical protein
MNETEIVKMKRKKVVWMPNNIAGWEVDLERKKFHLDDYGTFRVSAVARRSVELLLTPGDSNAPANLPWENCSTSC